MFDKLANVTGSGWKGYLAGVGLILYGVVLGIDATGVDVLPEIEATFDQAIETVLVGLGIFGIRHAKSNGKGE